MSTSFGALCTDFYVNQQLVLKMDLPGERETILHLFEQVRKSVPSMDRFRRYDDELALESRRDSEYRWLALRRNSIRTGHVNPQSMPEAYELHKLILQVSPYHLSISPLDVDYVELLFGFDLECADNHDDVVYEALFAHTPIQSLLKLPGQPDAKKLDVQPVFGVSLNRKGDLQAYFEVKTRSRSRRGHSRASREEPISILLTIRKYGPIASIKDLLSVFDLLKDQAEYLAADQVVPHLLTPIARQITSSNA